MGTGSQGRMYIRVRGRVQGVGYRYFVCSLAKRYSFTGWVGNRSDGSVELEVQGLGADATHFLEELRRGPPLGRVDQMDVDEREWRRDESGFRVIY
ncbi:MAG: acylphosphatase [Planctomycetes bacterium]|nr:acylphosphatase [Planctomycetota bacterium]